MSKRKKSPIIHVPQARSETSVPSVLYLSVLAGAVVIAVTAFLAYLPSINGGFILDDDGLLTENDFIKASDGLYRFWCTTETPDYWPVTNSNLWIDWRLWGTHPAGYHATNLILHVVESLLIWVILRKLSIPWAFWAALIFALHPVNVESVAWISQRKDMMAMLFFLLSILWYLKADMPTTSVGMAPDMAPARSHGGPWERGTSPQPLAPCPWPLFYWLSLAAFLLAMLSKGSAAVLPVLLLGIVWWLRPPGTVPIFISTKMRPFPYSRKDLLQIAPFFLVAVILAGVNAWFQTHGREATIRNADFVQRLLGAGCVPWFYLYKALLPIDLAFVYPQWQIQAGNVRWWLPLAAALIVTAVLWRHRNGWSRPLLFAWGFFCAALAPVMGFMDVGFMKYSLVADHYQHIAVIGVIALAAAGISAWHRHAHGAAHWAAFAVAVPAAGTLMLLTWRQSGLYRDAMTLYPATLEKNPACWMAHNNLGIALADMGRVQDAIDHYRQALHIKPDYPEIDNNLGNALIKIDHPGEAIEHYERSIRQKPDYADAYNNLGIALLKSGRPQEAIKQYRQALRLKPKSFEAHNNLGLALVNSDRLPEAIEHYQQALKIKPDYFDAHNNLGLALAISGRLPEAIEQYRQALNIKPNHPEAHYNLGNALNKAGKAREAIPDYLEAVRFNPNYAEAFANLASTYADAGQPADAVATAQKALEIARSHGQTALTKQIEDWLNSYCAGLSNPASAPPTSKSFSPTP